MALSLLGDVLCESDGWMCAQSLAVPLPGRAEVAGVQPAFTLGAPALSRAPTGEVGSFERIV